MKEKSVLLFSFHDPDSSIAQIVEKTICKSIVATNYQSINELKDDLLITARHQAVGELFGELVITQTQRESSQISSEQIQITTAGLVRIAGNPQFHNHESNLGEVCISIEAYITNQDKKKLEPISLNGSEECVTNENLTLRELEQIAENRAVMSTLLNRYPELMGRDEEKVIRLLKSKSFEGELVSRTGAYCTAVSGQVFPIEVQVFLSEIEQPAETSSSELVIGRNCNVREGPGTNYESVGRANTEDRFIVIGTNADNTWWQIQYNDQVAWVSEICVKAQHSVSVDATESSKQSSLKATATPSDNSSQESSAVTTASSVNAPDDIPGLSIESNSIIESVVDIDSKERDVYAIDLVAGETIKVGISSDELFVVNLYKPEAISVSSTAHETICRQNRSCEEAYTAAVAGTYYISIHYPTENTF